MEKLIFAQANGRDIKFGDKIFGINAKANDMVAKKGKDAVINGTIGSLLDDEGNLIVFDSVTKAMKELAPKQFAAYAPINGIPEFLDIAQELTFGTHKPNMASAAAFAPGGAGTIRNAVQNYTGKGDLVLTSDWFWAAYTTIMEENYRHLATYKMLDDNGQYNIASLEEAMTSILNRQKSLMIIINSPAHNPTGFSLNENDWEKVIDLCNSFAAKGKKVTIFVDAAYIDFTEDPEDARAFFPLFEKADENVLVLVGYSASKAFTMYGMRCGALVALSKDPDVVVEFSNIMAFSSRGAWSNGNRAAQQVVIDLYNDPQMRAKVDEERDAARAALLARGMAFEEAAAECGLEILPYDSGYFASIPCADSDAVCELLFEEGIFLVPLAKGIRIALSAVTADQCRIIAPAVKRAMDKFYGNK